MVKNTSLRNMVSSTFALISIPIAATATLVYSLRGWTDISWADNPGNVMVALFVCFAAYSGSVFITCLRKSQAIRAVLILAWVVAWMGILLGIILITSPVPAPS